MTQKPTIRARHPIADTGIFTIEELDLEFANGVKRSYQRLVGSERGAVLVIPILGDDTLLLIREYTAGMNRYELAFPKGSVDVGEQPLDAANRELQEEVGYAARQLRLLTSMTIAPGYLYHTTHIVMARNLYPQRLPGDEPEPIEVVPWKIGDYRRLLERPDFTESRSIAGLYIIRDILMGPGNS
ncbi:MAG: ADP compounds hydrolase NudE [Gammaproteobacteria bacterium]|nr:ADP compounds hydrolase NudE [Gammaproteobacteria bacterium]